jgi:hypothetical protein
MLHFQLNKESEMDISKDQLQNWISECQLGNLKEVFSEFPSFQLLNYQAIPVIMI